MNIHEELKALGFVQSKLLVNVYELRGRSDDEGISVDVSDTEEGPLMNVEVYATFEYTPDGYPLPGVKTIEDLKTLIRFTGYGA